MSGHDQHDLAPYFYILLLHLPPSSLYSTETTVPKESRSFAPGVRAEYSVRSMMMMDQHSEVRYGPMVPGGLPARVNW